MEKVKTPVQPAKFFGLRRTAWYEMVAFFALALAIDYLFGKRDRFFTISPHPFWIIVILISVQYGTNEGVMAAFLSSLLLLVGNLPEQSVLQNRFEYIVFVIKNPLLWFATAIFIGELRIRQIRERDYLQYHLALAEEREETIAESYESLKKIKENMELRIAGEMQTALRAYQVFKKLESLSKDEILLGARDLMNILVNPKKCSVFVLSSRGLELLNSTGWEEKDNFSQIFYATAVIYREIVSRQRVMHIINLEDRQRLANEGVLAAPILDPDSGEVYGMIKVELIPFLQLKMTTIETLKLIGEWIGKAYANRIAFERAKEGSFINPQTLLFSPTFFDYQRDFISALGKRLNFDVSLIKIILLNAENLTIKDKLQAGRMLNKIVKSSLRNVDKLNQPFEYEKQGAEFSILLPGTPKENVGIVVDRIKERLAEYPETTEKFMFEYHIITLNEKR